MYNKGVPKELRDGSISEILKNAWLPLVPSAGSAQELSSTQPYQRAHDQDEKQPYESTK
jgi:ribosomal protein L12E/L44/L45/RPP1/RPP2